MGDSGITEQQKREKTCTPLAFVIVNLDWFKTSLTAFTYCIFDSKASIADLIFMFKSISVLTKL